MGRPGFYSFEKTMKVLRKTPEELKTLVREGWLRAFRDQDKMVFRKEDVARFMKKLPELYDELLEEGNDSVSPSSPEASTGELHRELCGNIGDDAEELSQGTNDFDAGTKRKQEASQPLSFSKFLIAILTAFAIGIMIGATFLS